MATYPGAVTSAAGTPTVVGTTPWRDSDDATYAELTSVMTGGSITRFDRVSAPIDAMADTPTQVVVHMRAKIATNDISGACPVNLLMSNTGGTTPRVRVAPGDSPNFDWNLADTAGAIQDFQIALTDALYTRWSTTQAAMIALLQSGAAMFTLQCDLTSPADTEQSVLTVYELWIGEAAVTFSPAPSLRLTNRDDARLSGRRSRQGSPRLTGYL